MAILSQNSSGLILSLKVLLISTGVLSMAALTKFYAPLLTEIAISDLPSIWSSIVSWLTPPYLYLLINFIILTIVASSKFQHKSPTDLPPKAVVQPAPAKSSEDFQTDFAIAYGVAFPKTTPLEISPAFAYDYAVKAPKASEFEFYGHENSNFSETKEAPPAETMSLWNLPAEAVSLRNPPAEPVSLRNFPAESVSLRNIPAEKDAGDEISVLRSSRTPELSSSAYSYHNEKPPVSVRFGNRKAIKSSPEGGRTLRVAKTKRQDTLETTWKTITDGRPMPLTRHLRKSDTWETNGRHVIEGVHSQETKVIKSGTFNDRGVGAHSHSAMNMMQSVGSGKLKKEASVGQEELNRRVESFIKKFNEDMRLQRQESLNQYMEMINRGAH